MKMTMEERRARFMDQLQAFADQFGFDIPSVWDLSNDEIRRLAVQMRTHEAVQDSYSTEFAKENDPVRREREARFSFAEWAKELLGR